MEFWHLIVLAFVVAAAIMLLLRANGHRPHRDEDEEEPTLNVQNRKGDE